jgi:predicted acylesterase/phospholipase RssA
MYHIGVIKELVSHGLLPRIISGSSGGAIITGFLGAPMCCCCAPIRFA